VQVETRIETSSNERELDLALGELETLLREETAALTALDRDAIERISSCKLSVCERMTKYGKSGHKSQARRAQLQRIRRQAIHNQVLLVHARDSVRGVLALLTGQAPDSTRPASDGRMLHVRG
jgi:hypothetical protein